MGAPDESSWSLYASGRGSVVSLILSALVVGAAIVLALVMPRPLTQSLLHGWLAGAAGPWSLPAAIVAFAVFAFLGVPQFALIAAAVLAFGPTWGAFDSWVGTLISALVGFWLGRRLGGGALRRAGGARAAAILEAVGRNGFAASLIVRLLPSVPFLAVNMIAGALPISPFDYVSGTAIGIVPKIVLTAVAGGSLLHLPSDHTAAFAVFGAAALGWLGLSLGAFLWLRARQKRLAAEPAVVPAA
jgi:uncharacterized membrane protein YdjX (TVP38/TMEM64 family)